MVVYRSRAFEWEDCLTLHHVQGVSHAYHLNSGDYHIQKSASVRSGLQSGNDSETTTTATVHASNDNFCGISPVYEIMVLKPKNAL